jgi:hypothetical protein
MPMGGGERGWERRRHGRGKARCGEDTRDGALVEGEESTMTMGGKQMKRYAPFTDGRRVISSKN